MPFDHYIQKGGQQLRCGFTTGTCAALAAKAAVQMLLSSKAIASVALMTPKGIPVEVPVLEISSNDDCISCAVQKDAGDDPDITNGALVFASVAKTEQPGVFIDGGQGIGRVTKPGLDQPVGAAAINSVPRRMISSEVDAVCKLYGYKGGISVVISIPAGAELAKRTFNPKLGIEGGLSVLGTSGIVEPMSAQALIDCIGLELRTYAAAGYKSIVLTPGNYGEAFLQTHSALKTAPTVKFSNFAGDALDFCAAYGFQRILLVGHIGKLVKIAGGIMNTHSSVADCRLEIIAAHAALSGAGQEIVRELMNAVSTDACIGILDRNGLRDAVLSTLLVRIKEQLQRRVGEAIEIDAIMFSNVHGFLGQTGTAKLHNDSFV